jgi:hypothetical protein
MTKEISSRIYMTQDSINFTLVLDLSISIAEIPHATVGSEEPTTNIRREVWIARVIRTAISASFAVTAAIKIMLANSAIALRNVRAVINRCPMRGLLLSWPIEEQRARPHNNWKNWKQRHWVSQPWIANVKNKTFTLAVYAVRADVDDVVLIAAEARGRALSFNGTVEATQSGSGLGTELVANFSGLALTDVVVGSQVDLFVSMFDR